MLLCLALLYCCKNPTGIVLLTIVQEAKRYELIANVKAAAKKDTKRESPSKTTHKKTNLILPKWLQN